MRYSLVHQARFTAQHRRLGVALTKAYLDVPPLKVAFRVAAKTVSLLAIEPQ